MCILKREELLREVGKIKAMEAIIRADEELVVVLRKSIKEERKQSDSWSKKALKRYVKETKEKIVRIEILTEQRKQKVEDMRRKCGLTQKV
ncbi:MAG: hypothetical protein LBQ18_07710 [Campylobacteraceae bacterium]|jgi:hypothetical protein|nr:hypothetical protein [Campylobacteraceae bacterium]